MRYNKEQIAEEKQDYISLPILNNSTSPIIKTNHTINGGKYAF